MFDIILNGSRSFGGFEPLTSAKDFETWEHISRHYTHTAFFDAGVGQLQIDIDWSSRVAYQASYHQLYNRSEQEIAAAIRDFTFQRVHTCPATVKSQNSSDRTVGEPELHRLLLEIYLVANLSCPGTFNLYRSYIRNKTLDPAIEPLAQTDLELSEYVFETAWHEARKLEWLKVDFVSFPKVLGWYNELLIRGKNVATTDLERALFSLLHLGRASFLDPTAVMWLAGALEALFDTPSGNSFTFLCKRICALLELGGAEANELKRRLRSFFDIRNAFVHGGSSILHPLIEERDKAVDFEISNLLSTTNFASAVLIGSIQELIRRGWRGLSFEERVSGV